MKSPRQRMAPTEAGILSQLLDSGDGRLDGSWLLLREAVQCAEAENEIAAGDSHDLATRKEASQSIEGGAIGGVVKCWDDHDLICDIEVSVAGREALAREMDWRRHWQSFDAKCTTGRVTHRFQQSQIFLQWEVVRVVGILRDDGHNGVG